MNSDDRTRIILTVVIVGLVLAYAISICTLKVQDKNDPTLEEYEQLTSEYEELQEKYEELQTKYSNIQTDYHLHACPICGSDVEIVQVNKSFLIKCPNCDLATTFFSDKQELVDYWNNRKQESVGK